MMNSATFNKRTRMFGLGLALSVLAGMSFAQPPSPEIMVPKEALSELRRKIARQRGGWIPDSPVERHHQFRLNALLYSESTILVQPAVLTVEFDMVQAANINNERGLRNVRFTLEVQKGGNIPMPPYTMRTLGPDSHPDFFPPDPSWWSKGSFYSKESFHQDMVQFFIEAPANIEASAAGTVLDAAVKRLNHGATYGGQALLKLYPYCTRDLKTCHAGNLTGITFSKWGLGWVDHVYPDFRLISEETFSLAPTAGPAR